MSKLISQTDWSFVTKSRASLASVTAIVSVYPSKVQVGAGSFILGFLVASSASTTPNKVLMQVGVHAQSS
ncbi:MAG: hypothetical protein QF704_03000 [Anaerolineales bacterium]|nr:hypothetical protein [Anaerolineales bacterium]